MKHAFGSLLKMLLAIGAVFVALGLALYILDEKNDYIEIYNDQDDFEGDYF